MLFCLVGKCRQRTRFARCCSPNPRSFSHRTLEGPFRPPPFPQMLCEVVESYQAGRGASSWWRWRGATMLW